MQYQNIEHVNHLSEEKLLFFTIFEMNHDIISIIVKTNVVVFLELVWSLCLSTLSSGS